MKSVIALLLLFLSSVLVFGQTVTFTGIDKSHKKTRLVISKFSKTFDFEYEPILATIGEAVYKNDSAFTIDMKIETPTSVQISNSFPPIFSQIVWVEEGDSITFIMDADNRERPLHKAI